MPSYHLERSRKRIQRLKDLLGGVCVICGSDTDLQFDHVDPALKCFNITSNWSIAWDLLLKETLKCQLLCKSHHDEKTYAIDTINSHGTLYCYRHHKCRCDLCVKVNYEYQKQFKRKTCKICKKRKTKFSLEDICLSCL